MPANSVDPASGITRVDLAELVALRSRAGKGLRPAARVRAPLASGHRSALRGRGMEYAESRVYQAGDDARNIDWRRTARSGKWHTKLFEAERERSLLLLVDTHASMRFGTRRRYKSVAAARAAAWQAWTSVRAGDRVGALAFGDLRAAVDPRIGHRGALAVLGALARWDAQLQERPTGWEAGEPLSAALQRAQTLLTPGSRALLLSDGWSTDGPARTAMVRLARHVDLRVAIVVDALERHPAPRGTYVFETGQGRTRIDLGDAAQRVRLRDQLADGSRRLADCCGEAGIPCCLLPAEEEPDAALARLWRRRRHA